MAFEDTADQFWGQKPVHLFIFRRQGVSLRFASAERDLRIDSIDYAAAQIERDALRQTPEREKDKLRIRMAYLLGTDEPAGGWPSTQAVGDWWRPHIPSDPITVVCLSYDPGSADPPRVEWMGWAAQPVYGDAELELTCDPNPPAAENGDQGPRAQRACWKRVYSTGLRGCNLLESDFETVGELSAVGGLTLTAPQLVGTPFTLQGGTLRWERDDGIVEERPIMAHDNTAGTVQILWGGAGLTVGRQIVAVPNCPGTWAACEARRPDPQNHYGGAIYRPVKDPILEGVSMSWS